MELKFSKRCFIVLLGIVLLFSHFVADTPNADTEAHTNAHTEVASSTSETKRHLSGHTFFSILSTPKTTFEVPAKTVEIRGTTVVIPKVTVEIPETYVEYHGTTVKVPGKTIEVDARSVEIPPTTVQIPAITIEIPSTPSSHHSSLSTSLCKEDECQTQPSQPSEESGFSWVSITIYILFFCAMYSIYFIRLAYESRHHWRWNIYGLKLTPVVPFQNPAPTAAASARTKASPANRN